MLIHRIAAMFGVVKSSSESMAKSQTEPDAVVTEDVEVAEDKRLPMQKSRIAFAKSMIGRTAKKVTVTRAGKTFQQTVWVKQGEDVAGKKQSVGMKSIDTHFKTHADAQAAGYVMKKDIAGMLDAYNRKQDHVKGVGAKNKAILRDTTSGNSQGYDFEVSVNIGAHKDTDGDVVYDKSISVPLKMLHFSEETNRVGSKGTFSHGVQRSELQSALESTKLEGKHTVKNILAPAKSPAKNIQKSEADKWEKRTRDYIVKNPEKGENVNSPHAELNVLDKPSTYHERVKEVQGWLKNKRHLLAIMLDNKRKGWDSDEGIAETRGAIQGIQSFLNSADQGVSEYAEEKWFEIAKAAHTANSDEFLKDVSALEKEYPHVTIDSRASYTPSGSGLAPSMKHGKYLYMTTIFDAKTGNPLKAFSQSVQQTYTADKKIAATGKQLAEAADTVLANTRKYLETETKPTAEK